MNKKVVVSIVIAISVTTIVSSLFLTDDKQIPTTSSSFLTDDKQISDTSKIKLSYDLNHDIQLMLEKNGIIMSNPLKIQNDSVEKYCNFFSDKNIQNFISYCTSTEIVDSEGNFIGNIHMVGDDVFPLIVLGIMQTDSSMSQLDHVKTITNVMIESLVCQCWNDEKPGGIASVSDWVENAKFHHLEGKKTTSKSEINGLAQKQLLIEISTNTEGYLWKLLVK